VPVSLILQLDDDNENGLVLCWVILHRAKTRWFYPPTLGEDPERRTKAKTVTPPMTNPSTPISTVIPTGTPDDDDDDDDEEPEDMAPVDEVEEPDIDGLPTMPLSIELMLTKNRKLPASW